MLYYYIIVGVVGLLLILWLRYLLSRIQQQRMNRIDEVDQFEAINTNSPVSDQLSKARSHAHESIISRFSIIRRVSFILILTVWIFALIFPVLGDIPTALVSILVAAGAVVIGIAIRPFLENMISGVVISFSKQLRTGDTVIVDDHYGTVEDISLTHTVIKLWDWRRYIVPNSKMLSKEFLNLTISDSFIWEHVEFWVDHGSDMEKVKEIALRIAEQNQHFTKQEPPRFWVMDIEMESVKCWVTAWTDSPANAWLFKVEFREQLVEEFKNADIKSHTYRYSWEQKHMSSEYPVSGSDG